MGNLDPKEREACINSFTGRKHSTIKMGINYDTLFGTMTGQALEISHAYIHIYPFCSSHYQSLQQYFYHLIYPQETGMENACAHRIFRPATRRRLQVVGHSDVIPRSCKSPDDLLSRSEQATVPQIRSRI